MANVSAVLAAAAVYLRPRLIAIFFLGISSGFPLTLLISTLGYWFAQEGVSTGTIGLFSAMQTPYALKFLWSPLVDRVRLPGLARLVGQRRAWLLASQALLAGAIIALAGHDPTQAIERMAVFAFLTALMSATQDIVIDAYRIEILSPRELGPGSGMIQFGYRTGNLIAGAGALMLATTLGWPATFALMALLVLCGAIAALLAGEPPRHDPEGAEAAEAKAESYLARRAPLPGLAERAAAWLYSAVVAPFVEFLSRRWAVLILVFVVVYKIGDAMGQVMMAPLLVDLGFSNEEIAWANKMVGFVALILGTMLGGGLAYMVGMFRALLITGVAMMVTNLMFAWLATQGDAIWLLAVSVGFENFASGMGLAVFVTYLSGLCNLAFTATQYALLSSLASAGRTWLAAPSGFLADAVGWAPFYVLSTVAAVPGLILLWLLWRLGFRVRERGDSQPPGHSGQ